MRKIGIYKIRNTVNGKIYVGQSINIYERFWQHKYKSYKKTELAYRSAIHKAFRKYGIDAFEFSIIEECGASELDEREKYWIKTLNSTFPNGYNILPGGQSNRQTVYTCRACGNPIHRSSKGLCRSCYIKKNSKNYDICEIARAILEDGCFEKAASRFNVSSNAIVRWLKKNGLPYHAKDIVRWYKDHKEKHSNS